ncbi:MAG: NAD(P)/FAD-dependent oxidoreductase, partial [Verrucomicrobiales bacterium]
MLTVERAKSTHLRTIPDPSLIPVPAKQHIAVVGGGPAGLRAAEVAASLGASVTVYEAMPSVGRKFLVAGKSGLNLTNGEDWSSFLEKYHGGYGPRHDWHGILTRFNHEALRRWARELGIETFVASSGKVFPTPVDGTIRAAPLLRRWIEKLRSLDVRFKTRHRWTGFAEDGALSFDHHGSQFAAKHDATIIALGGASWPGTGSDGGWVSVFRQLGIAVHPFSP